MKVSILRDIETPDGTFFARTSQIDYDAKNPKVRKIHVLSFQQGRSYGLVGDKATYLTHEKLLELEQQGSIQLIR